MPIALTDEHEAQRLSARRWLDTHCPPSVPRALLDADEETLQPVWKEMAAQGWLGIHLPEEYGGQGFGLFELAVLLEETGWSVMPGPLLPTVVTSALVAEASGGTAAATAAAFLPGLADGSHDGCPVLRGPPSRRGGPGKRRRADGVGHTAAAYWARPRHRWCWLRPAMTTVPRPGASSMFPAPVDGSRCPVWPAWMPPVESGRSKSTPVRYRPTGNCPH